MAYWSPNKCSHHLKVSYEPPGCRDATTLGHDDRLNSAAWQNDLSVPAHGSPMQLQPQFGISPGVLVEQRRGGQTSLRSLLDCMRDGHFTGYLMTGMTLDGDTTHGVIAVESGKAVLAMYAFRPSGNNSVEMTYRGERAVEFTCGDALCPESQLELHALNDLREIRKIVGRDQGRGRPSARSSRTSTMTGWRPPCTSLSRSPSRSKRRLPAIAARGHPRFHQGHDRPAPQEERRAWHPEGRVP